MSQNRVRALMFDPACFPLPPTYVEYAAVENDDHILFVGGEKEDAADDHVIVFDEDEIAHVPALTPAGDYVIVARTLEGVDRFKVEFVFVHEATSTPVYGHTLDARDYLESFTRAFTDVVNDAIGTGNLVHASDNEEAFSKKYLIKCFKGLMNGNDAFWQRFYSDLDVATAPLNLTIAREAQGEPAKPIRFHKDTPKPVYN